MIRVLFIGDVSAKPGRETLARVLPDLKKELKVDLVAADIENIAHGKGATMDTAMEVMASGVDVMTGGNHIWRRKGFEELFEANFPLIRAINYPEDVPGKGYEIVDLGKKGKVLFALVQGRAFIQDGSTTDILRPLDRMLEEVADEDLSGIVVEIHAEATSEKVATGHYLDGRVSAVVGTHTHVPTADERILPHGTGYITDVGMVGTLNSVLWVEPEIIQQQLKYPFAPAYEVDESKERRFDAVLLAIENSESCSKIERVNKVL